MVVSYFMDYNYWVPLISEISKNINFSPKLYFLYFSIPLLRNKRESYWILVLEEENYR